MLDTAREQVPQGPVIFAVMGAIGTGKSMFIRLLTNDDTIRTGHNQDSETSDIQTANYIDQATGCNVMLIDTPGFDDSREGITDTDILQKIVDYLEPEKGKSQKLNGIIYMHRISNPRVGAVSRRNLRMFQSLCGDKNLSSVRIVTTDWDRVTEEDGRYREADLRNGAFKRLIDAGAQMCRHANTVESAQQIMSDLILLESVTTAIQEEERAGLTLAETGAGRLLTEAMQEIVEIREESEMASGKRNEALRAELELEYKALGANILRAVADRAKLERTLDERREAQRKRRAEGKAELARLANRLADERHMLLAEIAAPREPAMVDTARKQVSQVKFAVMGAIGTGKSTFIRLLTNDDTIHIGEETLNIETTDYIDQATGRHIMLIDTLGFDDSREGITDTDILQYIAGYLKPEQGKSQKLNGIIYMHRISDPRVGGVSRKNLRMFQSLCGDKNLSSVRIVTTNWDRVTEEDGRYREADLRNGAFKPLVDAGARMRRCAVTTAIQEEERAGSTLAETGASRLLAEAMREVVEIRKELEMAAGRRNEALRAELEFEYRALQGNIRHAEADQVKLARTLEENREPRRRRRAEEKAELARLANQRTSGRRMTFSTLLERSKEHARKRLWEDALNDANEAIEVDPSSPLGYERKHVALRGAGRHADAIDAFETMLSKMSQSPDPLIRERRRDHVWPEQTKETIRTAIKDAIHDTPLVLINVISGVLCDKPKQAAAFESAPIFAELVSTMTARIDHTRIKQEVEKFYHYATLSHTWQSNEPLYEKVIKIVVYDLEASPTHDKLRMFCETVRGEGFNWAWSDTICIDKGDHFALQEALFSMCKWYEGSAMTIIFLFDVDEFAEAGALAMSFWNTRGWALQEYHASKVVRVYTKNWKPYLGLDAYNHKDSQAIISEMEQATGISAQTLKALHPGLGSVREKLRLASARETTRVEDIAYSLLGTFSMTLPVIYGEGNKALGRLLSQLLTSSPDTSILAWTGRSGSFNSCLPADIAVFSQPLTSHIPPAITDFKMETIIDGLYHSPLDLDLVTKLYDQLNRLPIPFFVGQRMKLPCLVLKARNISVVRSGAEAVFHAVVAGLASIVEIKTWQNLTRLESLYLVHPWLDYLLDRRTTRSGDLATEGYEFPELDELLLADSLPEIPSASEADDGTPLRSPLLMDSRTVVYQFLARLGQPFGALLLTPSLPNVEEYRRVASDSVITVQVQEITSATLGELINGVRVLDVL